MRGRAVYLCLFFLSSGSAFAAKEARSKLVVLDLTAGGGVDSSIAQAFTSATTEEIAAKGYFDVISSQEMQSALGMERQRQLLGCAEDSCLTELAGALGARFVMSGSVTRLGDAYQLALQTVDSKRAQPLGRTTKIAKDLEGLRQSVPLAVAEATGTPPPPAPSHLIPFTLIGAGGLAVLGSALVALTAYSTEASVQHEQDLGVTQPVILKPTAYYQQQASQVRLEKDASLMTLAAGAALIGAGAYLEWRTGRSGTTAKVALVPRAQGFALVGVLP